MSLAILFRFLYAQHVWDINISIVRSRRLFCWITTLVVLFLVRCVLEFRCGWVGVVSVLQAEATCNTDTTLVFYSSSITVMYGPINIRLPIIFFVNFWRLYCNKWPPLCNACSGHEYCYLGADKSLARPGRERARMSGTRANWTSRRELSSSFFFPARQDAEGNSRHSDRNISLFPSWSV